MTLMKRVEFAGVAIEAASGSPVAVLREHDAPHRLLPIFIGGPEAASIAVAVSGQASPRPLTHDLMATLLETLHARVELAEVTELRDGAFLARLTVVGEDGRYQLDTRPSDAIALAVRLDAPLLVSEAVLDEAGSLPPPETDDEIDEAVDEFRSFLDEVDPAAFAATAIDADDGASDDEAPDDEASDDDPHTEPADQAPDEPAADPGG